MVGPISVPTQRHTSATIRNDCVFARLDPVLFQQCFRNWVNALTASLGVQVIAIDGKALKQSYDRNDKLKALPRKAEGRRQR